MAQELGLEQVVDFPTRQENTLDLVFTSHPGFKVRCKPLPPIAPKSDHDIVLFDTSHQPYRPRPTRRKIFLWNKTDIDGLRSNISSSSQTFLSTDYADIDSMWSAFKTTVTSAVDQHVPTKMTSTRHTHPWVDITLRKLMRKKQRAHRSAKRARQARDWNRYKKLQAEAQRSTRKAHKGYMEDIVSQDLKENSKRFWSFIKSKRQGAAGVLALMKEDGYLQSDSSVKAKILNKQFQSVYTRDDTDSIPEKGPSPYQPMQDISYNPDGVKKLLKDLKPYKAAGPDGIPTYILDRWQRNFHLFLVAYTSFL